MRNADSMKNSYKISVIIPVYNIEAYVSKCIESILSQTYPNLQIILVDDGSTDASGKICDTYARQDQRIQVIHQTNAGLVMARKAGLATASGEYIGFVDGDDYVESRFYENLLHYIVEDQADFVHTGYVYEIKDDVIDRCKFETDIYDLDKNTTGKLINEYVFSDSEEQYITFGVVSKLFRGEFIKKCYDIVPPSQSTGEDLLCLCVCLLEGRRVSFHKEALYHYVYRSDSLAHSGKTETVLKTARLYSRLADLFEKYNMIEQVEGSLNKYFVQSIMLYISRSDRSSVFVNAYTFDEVDLIKNKRVVLYGAGAVGQGYYARLCKYTSCTIVGWVDKNYEKITFDFSEVVDVNKIRNMQYDLILIAVQDRDTANDISQQLQGMGVLEEKIVWKKPGRLV